MGVEKEWLKPPTKSRAFQTPKQFEGIAKDFGVDRHTFFFCLKLQFYTNLYTTLPETNSSHLKITHPKRKLVCQPSISGAILISGSVIFFLNLNLQAFHCWIRRASKPDTNLFPTKTHHFHGNNWLHHPSILIETCFKHKFQTTQLPSVLLFCPFVSSFFPPNSKKNIITTKTHVLPPRCVYLPSPSSVLRWAIGQLKENGDDAALGIQGLVGVELRMDGMDGWRMAGGNSFPPA